MVKTVVIVIMAVAIVFLGVSLLISRDIVKDLRQELKAMESVVDATKGEEYIEGFVRHAIVFYVDGKKGTAIKFLEYASDKAKDQGRYDLGLLPNKMLKDPAIAKVLKKLPAKSAKKTNVLDLQRQGGLFHRMP